MMQVFEAFRGRAPSVEALLRHNNLLPAGAAWEGGGVAA